MKLPSLSRNQLIFALGCYTVLSIVMHIWVYMANPFGDQVDNIILNLIVVCAAMLCALILSLIAANYQKGEFPRLIWLNFAIALWSWTVGEIIWMIYNLIVGEVPDLTIADGFWFAGYIFFTLALVSQIRLVYFDQSHKLRWAAIAVWLAIVLCTIIAMTLSKSQSFFTDFLLYYYPFADLAVALAAVFLTVTFRYGILSRPWLSLFIFVVADSLYIWATSTGIYDWDGSGSSLLSMSIDLVYVLAYLAMAWGALEQYLALKFGPASKRITKRVATPMSTAKPE
jgi:hypothetical protein